MEGLQTLQNILQSGADPLLSTAWYFEVSRHTSPKTSSLFKQVTKGQSYVRL